MPLRKTRILIVEDEAILAYDLEMIIRDAGAEVVGPALFVEDALSLIRTNQISAAVLDVLLGAHDSLPVATLLAVRRVPFLFHTGHGTARELAQHWPLAPVLAKPVQADRLVRELARLLVTSSS